MSSNPSDWNFKKREFNCECCKSEFAIHEFYYSTIKEVIKSDEGGIQRFEYCLKCWKDEIQKECLSYWKTSRPEPTKKRKKTILDKDMLESLFHRLRNSEISKNRAFAYLLSLILMRKRVLVFDDVIFDDDKEFMLLSYRVKREENDKIQLEDPKLSEEEMISLNSELENLLQVSNLEENENFSEDKALEVDSSEENLDEASTEKKQTVNESNIDKVSSEEELINRDSTQENDS